MIDLNKFYPKNIIWEQVASGALSGLGSIFGGLFGKSGAEKAAEKNLQAVRETNEANRANQEYQNDWNLNQWNRQNEYNSPIEQRRRLEEAGLNPMFYGLDGSSAGSLQSAGFTAIPGAVHTNSGEYLGAGISNAVQSGANTISTLANSDLTNQNAIEKAFDNFIKKANEGSYMEMPGLTVEIMRSTNRLTQEQASEAYERGNVAYQQFKNLKQDFDYVSKRYDLDSFRTKIEAICRVAGVQTDQAKLFVNTMCDVYRLQQEDKRLVITEKIGNATINYYDNLSNVANEQYKSLFRNNYWDELSRPSYTNQGYGLDLQQRLFYRRQGYYKAKFDADFWSSPILKGDEKARSVVDTWNIITTNEELLRKQNVWFEDMQTVNYLNQVVNLVPNLGVSHPK